MDVNSHYDNFSNKDVRVRKQIQFSQTMKEVNEMKQLNKKREQSPSVIKKKSNLRPLSSVVKSQPNLIQPPFDNRIIMEINSNVNKIKQSVGPSSVYDNTNNQQSDDGKQRLILSQLRLLQSKDSQIIKLKTKIQA